MVVTIIIHLKQQFEKLLTKSDGAFRLFALVITITFFPFKANASSITCKGHFVNPITDICWSCMMPISIGSVKLGNSGSGPKGRDIKNPSLPVCMCNKGKPPVPVPGVAIGFWEPVRMTEVTRTPFCMVNLGGLMLGNGKQEKIGSYGGSRDKRAGDKSFYHVHYYVYPLVYWLELLTDFVCLERASFDIAYMSEYDVTWSDEKMQSLLNPDAALFGNPIAQAACGLDCGAATMDMPRDELFWCSGCWGNLYPLSGANSDFVGGVHNSSLLTSRILAKMHRAVLADETSTASSKINGDICKKRKNFNIKKSQLRFCYIPYL